MPSSAVVEVGEDFELLPYDELADTPNGSQRCRFVDMYVMDPSSAKGAAINAGYAPKYAVERAWELMTDDLVAAAVAQKMQERLERTMITQDRVLHELAILSFSDLSHYDIDPATGFVKPAKGVPEYVMRAISAIKFIVVTDEDGNVTRRTEFKLWSKDNAMALAMRHLGMLQDKLKIEAEVTTKQTWKVGDREITF